MNEFHGDEKEIFWDRYHAENAYDELKEDEDYEAWRDEE